jgi:pimeloyl-ACP methyl ester carboxylesterase
MTATRPAPVATTSPTDAGRAVMPSKRGFARSPDGVRIAYEVYGSGEPTIVLLPSTPIVHSRQWKGQVPYLSRTHRVVVFDGRGNGLSDRPTDPEAYGEAHLLGDIEAVMDATGTDAAVLIGLCGDGVWRAIELAAAKPERVQGIVAFAAGVPLLAPPHPWKVAWSFDDELPTDEGWAKQNRYYWRRDYPGFVRFFFEEVTSEPHSTKQIDDAVQWALEGSVDAMLADMDVDHPGELEDVEATCRAVRCPMLIVHGTEDTCQPIERSRRLSELTGAPLIEVAGADHMIPGRHPVLANLLIRDFIRSTRRTVS